ncbi:26S proteasome regulatory subunit 7 [Camellia lanceoleosa]|uniref:26S proteasome regulatory subunit 7 n=1 Tax=Camellia lanceoleosa TaxID=1840588 RepID=A0ACC0IHA2_9ERIC|nr:26S proteasome regulatory subunit 7 [Camellia lanceoleosa]
MVVKRSAPSLEHGRRVKIIMREAIMMLTMAVSVGYLIMWLLQRNDLEKFVNLEIDPPKGVLCYGPPGTGKTLLARAVANRAYACFIRVIGSELVKKYV